MTFFAKADSGLGKRCFILLSHIQSGGNKEKTNISIVKKVYRKELRKFNVDFIDKHLGQEGVFCMKRFPTDIEDARVKYVFEKLMK